MSVIALTGTRTGIPSAVYVAVRDMGQDLAVLEDNTTNATLGDLSSENCLQSLCKRERRRLETEQNESANFL
ncbi:unnamed protein product [Didymodactylos carnosus]|uniref:Uncharacterized protein n=1 Tax=Didymodactylos carnosus TaxID=1234261 RepID=A0A8S2DT76_9BILA|nr:unnamed protein product [Didymodactylos carnosus]CAF3746062.1 unnamed protein product [Didymodactylos carnosus]